MTNTFNFGNGYPIHYLEVKLTGSGGDSHLQFHGFWEGPYTGEDDINALIKALGL